MGNYRIFIKSSAVKDIEAIALKQDRQQIINRIAQLADDPRPPGCTKLSGYDRYRIRHSAYRIVYSIEDRELTVYVVTVGHCNEISRRL